MHAAVVQSLSRVWLFATPWTAAYQFPPPFTITRSSFKLISIELVMPPNLLILCRPLLFKPQSFPASGSSPMSRFFSWVPDSFCLSYRLLYNNTLTASFLKVSNIIKNKTIRNPETLHTTRNSFFQILFVISIDDIYRFLFDSHCFTYWCSVFWHPLMVLRSHFTGRVINSMIYLDIFPSS